MKKKIIYIYPEKSESNKYVSLMAEAYKHIGYDVVGSSEISSASFISLNWFEETSLGIRSLVQMIKKVIILAKWKIFKKKIIWTIHNKKPHELNVLKLFTWKICSEFLLYFADAIIIHSSETIKEFRDLGIEDKCNIGKVCLIPHPNYIGQYGGVVKNNTSDSILKILFVGTLRPYKNLELLLAVLNDLDLSSVEVSIYGAGSTDYVQSLKKSCYNKNISIIDGFVCDSKLPDLYANHHLVVLPYSITSVLNSGSVINAFSYQRAVISSKIGTLSDISNIPQKYFDYEYENQEEHFLKLYKLIDSIIKTYSGRYNDLLLFGKNGK